MKMFSSPFNIDVDTVPEEFQMVVIDMQNNTDLQNVIFFHYTSKILKISAFGEKCKANNVSDRKYICTYVCEQLFSTIQLIKPNERSRLSNGRLESYVRLILISLYRKYSGKFL